MLFDKYAQNILELSGVEGLCLVDAASSALLCNRMPSFIPDFAFEPALRRVSALYEAVDGSFLPADDYVFRFAGNSIILRRAAGVILILFASEAVHLVSLRIVTNIVLKNLQTTPAIVEELRKASQQLAASAATKSIEPVATAMPAATPVAAPDNTPAKATKSRRVYRGVVIAE